MENSQGPYLRIMFMLLSTLLFCMVGAVSKKEVLAKAVRSPAGADIFFDHQTGTFDYWIYYRQLRGDGGSIEYTVKRNDIAFTASTYFISIPIMVGQSGLLCKYAPVAYRLRIDARRSVFRSNGQDRCSRSFFGLGGSKTTTNWKYCDTDEYISCSTFRCKCKAEGAVQVVVYDGQGDVTDPGQNGLNRLCSPPF